NDAACRSAGLHAKDRAGSPEGLRYRNLKRALRLSGNRPQKGVGIVGCVRVFCLLSLVFCLLSFVYCNAPASRRRNNPTSVTMPIVCDEPRSASLVTTAGLMSTQTRRTHAGSILPTPIPCSIVDSTSTSETPCSAAE